MHDDDSKSEGEDDADSAAKQNTLCTLVWRDIVSNRAFEVFSLENVPTEIAAHKLLERYGVEHYYHMAKT